LVDPFGRVASLGVTRAVRGPPLGFVAGPTGGQSIFDQDPCSNSDRYRRQYAFNIRRVCSQAFRNQSGKPGRFSMGGELGTRQYERRGAEAVALADCQAAGLDPPRQHADDPGRGRGRPAEHPQRSTIRHGTLAKAHGLTTGTRVDVPTTRPPQQETKQRYLTPFLTPFPITAIVASVAHGGTVI
jgi:hypothetical protein